MRRVAIIGPGGAGKTTLARELARRLGIEVVELDRLFWRPGWVKASPEECEELQREALSGVSWITDSGAPRALRSRLEAADTVVFLDLPLWLCALRTVLRRRSTRGRPREELPAGCTPGRLDRALVRYASYVWRYRRELRPQILADLDRLSGERDVVVLRDGREVRRFVDSLGRRDVPAAAPMPPADEDVRAPLPRLPA
jgi:adenylate kinase family enzyme